MAVTDAYSTAALYRARFGLNDSTKDAAILTDLTSVSRMIDRLCDRFFTKDASAVARVYYPAGYWEGSPEAENPWRGVRGQRILNVDDIAAVPTSVVVDENRTGTFSGYTAWTAPASDGITGGDYQCFPLSALRGSEPKPWMQLYVPTWSTKQGWAPGCMVQVTAVWGWPSVPGSIVDATLELTGILRLDSPRASQRIPEASAAAFGASTTAVKIIDDLQRAYKRERIYA